MTSVYGRYPRNGLTAKEVAKKNGSSLRTAQRWTSRPREEWLSKAAEKHELIRQLRAKGSTYREIAAEIGCSIGTVHNALKDEAA